MAEDNELAGHDTAAEVSQAWADAFASDRPLAEYHRAVVEAEDLVSRQPDNGVFTHGLACARAALEGAKERSQARTATAPKTPLVSKLQGAFSPVKSALPKTATSTSPPKSTSPHPAATPVPRRQPNYGESTIESPLPTKGQPPEALGLSLPAQQPRRPSGTGMGLPPGRLVATPSPKKQSRVPSGTFPRVEGKELLVMRDRRVYRYPIVEPEVTDPADDRIKAFRHWVKAYLANRPPATVVRGDDIRSGLKAGTWGILEGSKRCESCVGHQRPPMGGQSGLACVTPVVEVDGHFYVSQKCLGCMLKSKGCSLSPNTSLGPRGQLVLPADEVLRRRTHIDAIHTQAAAIANDSPAGLVRNAAKEILRLNYIEYHHLISTAIKDVDAARPVVTIPARVGDLDWTEIDNALGGGGDEDELGSEEEQDPTAGGLFPESNTRVRSTVDPAPSESDHGNESPETSDEDLPPRVTRGAVRAGASAKSAGKRKQVLDSIKDKRSRRK